MYLWQDAQAYCASLGGNLPSINDQGEQDVIAPKAIESKFNPWIGYKAQGRPLSLIHI